MAICLLVEALPTARRVATTPGQLTKLALPPGAAGMQISVYAEGDCYLTYTGFDGEAPGDAVRLPLIAHNWLELDQLGREVYIGADGQEPVGAVFNFAVWRGDA